MGCAEGEVAKMKGDDAQVRASKRLNKQKETSSEKILKISSILKKLIDLNNPIHKLSRFVNLLFEESLNKNSTLVDSI